MVQTVKLTSRLDGEDIVRLFKHTDNALVAPRIPAVGAHRAVADVIADGANAKLFLDVDQRLDQAVNVFPLRPQNVKRNALRRLLTDTGQAFDLEDEAG